VTFLSFSEYGWRAYPTAYGRSLNILRKLRDDYAEAFNKYDVLVMPTLPCVARRHVPWNASPLLAAHVTRELLQRPFVTRAI
jgi:amidase